MWRLARKKSESRRHNQRSGMNQTAHRFTHHFHETSNDIKSCLGATQAERGLRTLGVAVRNGEEKHWTLVGLISLFDPPRSDTARTIERAMEYGVDVKMITGPNSHAPCDFSGQCSTVILYLNGKREKESAALFDVSFPTQATNGLLR